MVPDQYRRAPNSLPDVRYETMAHTACVFVVARKIAAEDPFLIEKPPEKYRQDEWDETDREPRAERKRHADEKPFIGGKGIGPRNAWPQLCEVLFLP